MVFWMEFLRSLVKRGLKGVKLDAHEGLKAAAFKVFQGTTCRDKTLILSGCSFDFNLCIFPVWAWQRL